MQMRFFGTYNISVSSGKRVFWHSSSHILGGAAERYFCCDLCVCSPTEDGFYADLAMEDR